MRDLANRALDLARVQGASYADIRIVRRDNQSITVKNGNVEALAISEDQGFGVRVIVNGFWGFASSSRLEPNELDAVTAAAIRTAKASSQAGGKKVDIGPPLKHVASYHTPIQKDPFAIPLEDKIAVLLAADKAMRTVKEIRVAESSFGALRESKTFASTEDSYIEQVITETGGGIEATAVGHDDVQKRSFPNSFGRHQGTSGYEFFEAMKLAENAERIAEEAAQLLTAKRCTEGVTTIVLDATQLALQVHESCGHPIELDRVLGYEAAFAGTSFLTTDKMGTFRYGSDIVNINADATISGGLGTFGYDDEGVPGQRTPIIRNGIFVGYLS